MLGEASEAREAVEVLEAVEALEAVDAWGKSTVRGRMSRVECPVSTGESGTT
jgi:hypothetical protein